MLIVLGGLAGLAILSAVNLDLDLALPAAQPAPGKYADIPLTEHAKEAHATDPYNAQTIVNYFDTGKCIPQEYACAALDYRVSYCRMANGKSIGLIIGIISNKIITGFMATNSYWGDRCEH